MKRRGTLYVAVVGTTMLVAVIATAAILASQVRQRSVAGGQAATLARIYAQSAVELGLQRIADTSTWRTSLGQGTWYSGLALGDGRLVLTVTGPSGAALSTDVCSRAEFAAYGYQADARQAYRVQVEPDAATDMTIRDAILTLNPVGYWRLGESAGTTAVDEVKVNPGIYRGGITLDAAVPYDCDGAPQFDRVDDFVEIPHHPGLLLSSGSIAFWFNSADISKKQGLISKDSVNRNDGQLRIWLESKEVRVTLESSSSDYTIKIGNLADGWHQVVLNWGSGGMRLIVDGASVANAYTGGLGSSTQPLVIGVDLRDATAGTTTGWKDPYGGLIDEVAVFGRALSLAEAQALYTLGTRTLTHTVHLLPGTWAPISPVP